MESKSAIAALSALAHESRLAAFRALVRAGEGGVPAGELARLLSMPPNSLSTNLGILSHAGLVSSRREGRSVRYFADYQGMSALVGFLMKDCCQGRIDLGADTAKAALGILC
jgi:DNA-binding transcriptional ArsR family regulator